MIRPFCLGFCLLLLAAGSLPSPADEPRAVAFQTDDGLLISAEYYRPTAPGPVPFAILLHGHGGDRGVWKSLAVRLSAGGMAALAVDLRGHGQSTSEESRIRMKDRDPLLFEEMQRDLRAAYDWLATQEEIDRARFAIIGAEAGAAVALRYAARDRSVDALALLTPPLEGLGMDSRSDMAKVKGRAILLVAADEPEQRRAVETLEKLTDGTSRHLVPGSGRGADLLAGSSELEARVADFLQKAVGAPSPKVVYGSINSHIYHLRGSGWIERIGASNLRFYSSPQEAEARGVRRARNEGPQAEPREPPGPAGGRKPGRKP
jgi:dienelactone hydrolase